MNDALILIGKLESEMSENRSVEEIEKAWTHFHTLSSFCERTWPGDKRIMNELETLKRGLGVFTGHIREGALSPFSGFHTSLRTLRRYVDNDVDDDGWPKSPRYAALVRKGRG